MAVIHCVENAIFIWIFANFAAMGEIIQIKLLPLVIIQSQFVMRSFIYATESSNL